MSIRDSELIINPDGSIYHLSLLPDEIAETIITVGDQNRVEAVSQHFDSVDIIRKHREFVTHTGMKNGHRLSVISTGIGTDNIDIVLNELDALVNIDFSTRSIKEKHTPLTLVRVGTSGSVQPDIAVDSLLVSAMAIGFDNLPYFYDNLDFLDDALSLAFKSHTKWSKAKSEPYGLSADAELLTAFRGENLAEGITATNVGFYGPQGRVLRLGLQDSELNEKITSFRYKDHRITNMEMETAGIYAMAQLLGHRAISLNAILANRIDGSFSNQPQKTVDRLIEITLSVLTT